MRLCKLDDAVQEISEVLAKHNAGVPFVEISSRVPENIPVENHVENSKSLEQQIDDILPRLGPESKKDVLRNFTSDFGNLTWNATQKIITFDNGVVFTEKELLTLHQEHQGRKLTVEEWNLKMNFKGRFVEPELRMFDAKAS